MSVPAALAAALADRYRLDRELGQGGMATVYLAHDLKHDRDVALKVLRPELAASLGAGRFLAEIRLTAHLSHPHILPLLDSGEAAGFLYYAMPFVEGESLRDLLARRGELPVAEVVSILRDVCRALAYAHQHGVVHRDIKPDNVLLSGGAAAVADFGVAKAVSASAEAGQTGLTSVGVALGTPAYMAPEQAAASPTVDHRADLYALGVTAYEMLTGQPPYVGRTPEGLLAAQVSEPPEPILKRRPVLPPHLAALVMRLLEKRAADRPQTAEEVLRAVDSITTPSAGHPPTSARLAIAARLGRRRWLVAGGVGAVLLVVAAVFVLRGGSAGGAARCAGSAQPALAVLPFDVGGDTANEYFADGLTDELAGALGKVPGLRVTGRTSSYAFKGQSLDAQTVGRRLGVTHLVEASVRRAGSRVRVQAQLVCAADGFVLWSAPYEREVRDVFAVQDSVTAAIVGELRLQLTGTAAAATRAGRTENPEAHDLYLRGRFHLMQGGDAGIRRAMEMFNRAIAVDSTYADAYSGLAMAWMWLADVYVAPLNAYPQAKVAAARALALDSLDAVARAVYGYASAILDFDFAFAERELRQAMESAPRSVDVGFLFANFACLIPRLQAEGLEVARGLEVLDPFSPMMSFQHVFCLYVMRRYDEAIAAYHRALALDSTFLYADVWDGAAWREKGRLDSAVAAYRRTQRVLGGTPLYGLAVTLARMGRTAEARVELRRLEAVARQRYVAPGTIGLVYVALGDRDVAFGAFERSLRAHDGWLWGLTSFPELDPVRDDPRFAALLRRAYGDWSPR